MPLVSIIIPHYNRAKLLAETIDSVRSQHCKDWEVIVVDDGSAEREWRDIQSLADKSIRVIKRTDGIKGPSRCRNMGVSTSQGDYVMFLDSDDLLAPWCLSERLMKAEEFPDNDLWVFQVMLFDKTAGDLSVCWNSLKGKNDLERFLRSDPPWHTSSSLWRREAFDRIGGFNEAVMYGDDTDLHVRALLRRLGYAKYPEVLPDVFVRRSERARITNRRDQTILESRLVRLLEGSKALNTAEAKVDMRKIWEGQYFVEGEFLLFNTEQPGAWIHKVLKAWIAEFHPSLFRRLLVKSYFMVAQATRDSLYIVLRLARRFVILMAPKEFFPRGGAFHSHEIAPEVYGELRHRLGYQTKGTVKSA
jgi:glycosyltransferase involved in cell wall biosynthesis